MMRIFPTEFRRHVKAMVREGLLAIRSLVDAGIESLEKPSRREEARPEQPPKEETPPTAQAI